MIDLEIDEARRLARIVLDGAIEDRDVISWWTDEFMPALEGRAGLHGLIDARAIGDFDMSTHGVRRVVELAAESRAAIEGTCWAIVAVSDAVFGMARMYEMSCAEQPFEIRVFREVEAARAWLDAALAAT